jgi:hypothetical protein
MTSSHMYLIEDDRVIYFSCKKDQMGSLWKYFVHTQETVNISGSV